jgi:hypothetical protein
MFVVVVRRMASAQASDFMFVSIRGHEDHEGSATKATMTTMTTKESQNIVYFVADPS